MKRRKQPSRIEQVVSDAEMREMLEIGEPVTEIEVIEPRGRGRPTSYKPEYCNIARAMCMRGATNADLADAFDVTISTIYLWQATHAEFSESIKAGKDLVDDFVERSLYLQAVGYAHDDVDVRVIDDQVVLTPLRKQIPPNPTAAIFWLKNRRPDRWRDIKAVELSGRDGGAITFVASDDDLKV